MTAKLLIKKVCENCGNVFTAKRTTTRYCSHKCNSAHYKEKARSKKVSKNNVATNQIVSNPVEILKTKEFLSVNEASKLIGCSRQAIYKMINTGRLNASRIMIKKTIIKRADIDSMLQQNTVKELSTNNVFRIENYYYLEEIVVLFGVSQKALYEIIKRNNIKKIKQDPYVYILKKDIHNIFGKPQI
jgi:excisionase family DNA binding protein